MGYKKTGLKNRIAKFFLELKLINPDRWIHKGEIEDLAKGAGYLGDNAGRQLRKLVEEGILEKRKCGNSGEYRYNW